MSSRPSIEGPAPVPPAIPTEGDSSAPLVPQNVWRDSSLELERGLDVTELEVDLVLPLDPNPARP